MHDMDVRALVEKLAAKSRAAKTSPSPSMKVNFLKPFRPQISTREDLKTTKAHDLALWKTWKDNGHKPEHLEPLLNSFERMIKSRAQTYRTVEDIPKPAIEAELKVQAVNALRTYKPGKGAALGTWVTQHLQRAGRYVLNNQNFARITEGVGRDIGRFRSAQAELTETLGHEPDVTAISEHSGLPMKQVIRLNREIRKGLVAPTSSADGNLGNTVASDPNEFIVKAIYPQLTPDERVVHEYVFGLNGRPQIDKTGRIAKAMKVDDSKVSKLRTSIRNKMLPYLE